MEQIHILQKLILFMYIGSSLSFIYLCKNEFVYFKLLISFKCTRYSLKIN